MINHGKVAKVFSISTNTVNLLVDDDALITLSNSKHAVMPMGLVIENGLEFNRMFKAGDLVRLGQDHLVMNSSLGLIQLESAQVWDPTPDSEDKLKPRDSLVQITDRLIDWLTLQPRIGLLPLLLSLTAHSRTDNDESTDSFSRYIAGGLLRFVDALSMLDWKSALKTAYNLVGFGIGSTPSCDDFLVAYLVVLTVAQKLDPNQFGWVIEFNHGISELAKARTTTVSAHMLTHAASGKVSQNHQRLIQACIFDDKSDWFELVRDVAQTGASSGMDFLLGLVCALDWFSTNFVKYPVKGGAEQVESYEVQPETLI